MTSNTYNTLNTRKYFGPALKKIQTPPNSSVYQLGHNTKIKVSDEKAKGDHGTNDVYETNINIPSEKIPLETPLLPQTLLRDIRKTQLYRSELTETFVYSNEFVGFTVQDEFDHKFHIHENNNDSTKYMSRVEEEGFAGYKNILQNKVTICSARGTVRGVKNRVREGIATFLYNNANKNYKENEEGKVIVYTTTIGILRETYYDCMKVKQILRTQLVKFEERDVFMNSEYQAEIKKRICCNHVSVPQVFLNGHHVGDADTIEKLNETGELRKILEPYKSMDVFTTCSACGGYRLLPCQICKGSKKSVHRNHFTAEFVALKCMNCDEVGLVRCLACS